MTFLSKKSLIRKGKIDQLTDSNLKIDQTNLRSLGSIPFLTSLLNSENFESGPKQRRTFFTTLPLNFDEEQKILHFYKRNVEIMYSQSEKQEKEAHSKTNEITEISEKLKGNSI